MMARLGLACLLATAMAAALGAQQQRFRAGVELVSLNVTVTDGTGRSAVSVATPRTIRGPCLDAANGTAHSAATIPATSERIMRTPLRIAPLGRSVVQRRLVLSRCMDALVPA